MYMSPQLLRKAARFLSFPIAYLHTAQADGQREGLRDEGKKVIDIYFLIVRGGTVNSLIELF